MQGERERDNATEKALKAIYCTLIKARAGLTSSAGMGRGLGKKAERHATSIHFKDNLCVRQSV